MENLIDSIKTKINKLGIALDQLADSTGRAKCGIIWAMSEVLTDLNLEIDELIQNGIENSNSEGDEVD